MGGTDITSTAYNSDTGVVSIAAVTGDVVITAKATKVVSYHNLVPKAVDSSGASAPYTDGLMLSSSGTTSEDNHLPQQDLSHLMVRLYTFIASAARVSHGMNMVHVLRGIMLISPSRGAY